MAAKRLLRFVFVAAVVYLLLAIFLWPLVDAAYASFFRSVARAVLSSDSPDAVVEFRSADRADTDNDIVVGVGKRLRSGGATGRSAPLSSYHMGFLSAAFLTALIVASPMPPRRKGWALVVGLVLIHAFALFRVWLLVVNLGSMESVGIYHLGLWTRRVFSIAFQLFVKTSEAKFIAPVLVWLLVSLRPNAWPLQDFGTSSDGDSAPAKPLPRRDRKPQT